MLKRLFGCFTKSVVIGGGALVVLVIFGLIYERTPEGRANVIERTVTAEFRLAATATEAARPTDTPTLTPLPTDTPTITLTPPPSVTPHPTRTTRPTNTPRPTDTPAPTWTRRPTATVTPRPAPLPTRTPAPPPPPAPVSTLPPPAGVCSCSGDTLNCGDFSTHSQAQACFNHCMQVVGIDIHKLDSNNDGNACESLP